MKKTILFFSVIAAAFSTIKAQETSDAPFYKVPHQISIEGGYRYVLPVIDNSAVLGGNSVTNGYGLMLDYGWKVSGFSDHKSNIYLTIPIGYSVMLPDNPSSVRLSMLNYGWTVRHEIGKGKKITPFAGYGLLLNSLSVKGVDGSVMGHQTRFEFGANLNTSTKLKYYAKLQYSYASFPRLDDDKRIHFQFLDLRLGVRF